jgi:hypothetical protein
MKVGIVAVEKVTPEGASVKRRLGGAFDTYYWQTGTIQESLGKKRTSVTGAVKDANDLQRFLRRVVKTIR